MFVVILSIYYDVLGEFSTIIFLILHVQTFVYKNCSE